MNTRLTPAATTVWSRSRQPAVRRSPKSRASSSTRRSSSASSNTPVASAPASTVLITASCCSLWERISRSASSAAARPLSQPPRAGSSCRAMAIARPGRTPWAIRLACRMRRCVSRTVPTVEHRAPSSTAKISGRAHQGSACIESVRAARCAAHQIIQLLPDISWAAVKQHLPVQHDHPVVLQQS